MRKEPNTDIKKHFQKASPNYQKIVNKEDVFSYYYKIQSKIEPHLKGKVIDIGSGGITKYSNPQIKQLISMDYVIEFLKNRSVKNIIPVNGDIRNIPLKNNSVDFVIIQFVIHHLTDRNFKKNLDNVKNAISESYRVLKKGGIIYIVESALPSFLEKLEILNYKLIYFFLTVLRKPMVFFFSKGNLSKLLRTHGLILKEIAEIYWGDTKQSSIVLFPWLRIPHKFLPFKCIIISSSKTS